MAKKDKKKGKKQDDDWDIPSHEDATTAEITNNSVTEGGFEVAEDPLMDDLADDFGGLMSAIKKTKGKKGKKQQVEMVDANEELQVLDEAPSTATAEPETAVEKDDEQEGGEFRVKTKKEKEKEKKEKDKAKKKAQAEKKKAASTTVATPEPEPKAAAPEPVAPQADGESDEEEGQEETAGSKSKKKKKKGAAKKEEAPAATATKKKGPNISALQKRLAAQQAAEEARRKAEEEEAARIAEAERRAAEEEARKEEEKRLKKERERAKREDLRKKGLLLSKKQKEQARLAALRNEQLLASGNVSVAGLSGDSTDGQKAKRPVYGNRKKGKKEPEKSATAVTEEKSETKEAAPEPTPPAQEVVSEPVKESTLEDDVVDEWEEAAVDSWEDNIDEHGNIQLPEPKKKLGATNGVAAAKEKEDEEEDDDDDDDDDDEESEDEDSDSDDDRPQTAAQKAAAAKKAEAAIRREEQHKQALAARSRDNLRSPICCILGHVDTGKTKLLDKIRQTNVQEGEAGGITQQIGATYFPLDAIKTKTAPVNRDKSFDFKIPGLLIIDTPGHESFTNLRSRGSSLCNIAILVIDIMHGLEPQTLESIRLLRDRKTPFIVALNKIDRIYGWNATPDGAFRESLAKQNRAAQSEFKDRCDRAIVALQEQGLNSVLYYENKNFAKYVSIVPTSAHTGEGIPDMLMLLVKLTQERMTEKLMYLSELECTVLEVKVIEGLGTTIDVVLSNGVLREGDRIVICGLNGPIITNVRALLTPEPMKEMRVKSAYVHHKEVKAALGVKITAQDLSNAIAGSRLLVVGPDDDEDDLADEVMGDLKGLLNRIDKTGKGVCVQASTLGSLEALLEFLKTSKIPVSGINIGPVHKRDIMRCATMLERAPEFAVMLCFDVKIDREAEEMAAEMGVKVFSANIIYHLFDSFTAYQKELLELKRKEASGSAVFPCVLKILQVFHSRDPIVLGVDVIEGSVRVGTPIAAVKVNEVTKERTVYTLGKISSIEQNHKSVDSVKKGQAGAGIAIKIEGATQQLFGRHIDEKETLYSQISRHSIDTLKSPAMRDEVTKDEWQLIVKLKTVFGI